MCRRLRSIEYGFPALASTGILFSLANAIISARPGNCFRNFSSRHGAITFNATADDNKRPLDGRCDVIVSGVTPAARFWTLTLYDRKGHLVANSLQRYGFTSEEMVRSSDGSFAVRVASRARAGNWLPTGGIERYALMLRLYDTPVGVATRTQRDAPMPSIATGGCS